MPKKLEWEEILPRGYLSPSSIDTYLMCPKSWEYAYLHDQERSSSPALDEGLTLHHALAFMHEKIEAGEEWTIEEVLKEWAEDWTRRMISAAFDPAVRLTRGEKSDIKSIALPTVEKIQEEIATYLTGYATGDEVQKRATKFLKDWKQYHLKGIKRISTVEEFVEGEIEGIPIQGYMDLTYHFDHPEVKKRTVRRVVDFKCVTRAKSQRDAENSVQLGIYSLLTGIRNVGFVSFSKTTGKITTQYVTLEDRHLRRVKGVVRSVAEAIKKKSFPFCDPNHWKCQPQYCDAFEACPQGGGDGPSQG